MSESARARGHALARACFDAALDGADAGAATAAALARTPLPPSRRCFVAALGKAAAPMATAAVQALQARGMEPAGGVVVMADDVVAADDDPSAVHPALEWLRGDHPVPGERSRHAAERLGVLTTRVHADDALLVLLSGGTSSLVAAPVAEVDAADLTALFAALLGAGADIHAVNAVRKRFSRWGGGRLAAAVAPAAVRCLAVSDVAGDDLAAIGSGPCTPDALDAAALQRLIEQRGLREHVPLRLRELLALVAAGRAPETPKPGDAAFARVESEVVLDNRAALQAAATRAAALGAEVRVADAELQGAADDAGRALAAALLRAVAGRDAHAPPLCLLWGGEPTVTLGQEGAGRGGRCQELALAAAERLAAAGGEAAARVVLLAAGTDGRDGPTDAAGAAVDAATWRRAAERGVDPAAALRRHDSYPALHAAGALLPRRSTGTNVRDVVVGIVA